MAERSKISRAKGVETCIELLQSGKSRKEILQQIAESYKASTKTVDNWMREARVVVQGRRQEAETIRRMQMDETISDAVKEGLLSDMEIELILCKIISGEVEMEEWIRGKVILRTVTPTEVTNAAKAIYAKRGSNAAAKIEHSGGLNLADLPIIFK